MAAIAFIGDCTTTTALAVAAGWPGRGDDPLLDVARSPHPVVVECDRSGGSLAAWLDLAPTPSLSTAVTALHREATTELATSPAHRLVDPFLRRSASGVRVMTSPFRSREARTAVDEGGRVLFGLLSSMADTVALFDTGRHDLAATHPAVRHAELVVVIHRQDASSARAAAARLERLSESLDTLADAGRRTALAVIGDEPFGVDEIIDFAGGLRTHWLLPSDPLAAAVLAGRSGVSARRLARLPLMRAAAAMAADLSDAIDRRPSTYDDIAPSPAIVGGAER